MEKFGKARITSEGIGAQKLSQSEDVQFDLCKKAVVLAQTDNNAEDKFLEDALKGCENLFKEKKVWTDMNRLAQIDRETPDAPAPTATTEVAAADKGSAAASGVKKYVPPSIKAAQEAGKGGGKGDYSQEQEASLRISNLSEVCEEETLRMLFANFGRLRRVFLSRDERGLCKGFAFVTFDQKKDADKAVARLNGHGLDNLIMQVQWAKPRT
jgi:hypothetical protein